MITLPGLIDPHVHLRTPGQSHKEDFYTGTAAALAGGYTTIIDMPNNLDPITTLEKLKTKQDIARTQTVCDLGFHFGSLGENFGEFAKVQNEVLGIKIYLNQTTGNFIVDAKVFDKIAAAWPVGKPILVHAEADVLEEILEIGEKHKQKLHVCHISSEKELTIIMQAKEKGYTVTCGVTPHHLFLNETVVEKLGAFAQMKPALKPQRDVDFLWQHLKDIDLIESDHAPHTKAEKQSENPPFGVTNLETTLPLLLTALSENKISLEEIKRLCHDNAAKIFGIKPDDATYVEVDENETWTLKNEELFTKCKISPFDGWQMKGRVKKVVLHGKTVFENGKILAEAGSGKIIV